MSLDNVNLNAHHAPVAVNVTTVSTVLVAARVKERSHLLIQNASIIQDVWIDITGGTAVVGPPCLKLTAGGVYNPTSNIPLGAITARAGAASAPVTVDELGF